MNQEMSNEVIAALRAAGLEYQEGVLYVVDADADADGMLLCFGDDATAMLRSRALAIAQAFPAAEVRRRLSDALREVSEDLECMADDLHAGTAEAEAEAEEEAAWLAKDALIREAQKREWAGKAEPGDAAILAEFKRDCAADNAELAARGIVLGAPLIDLATDPAGPIKNPVLDVHTCVPA
jgi:hypothetical protein